MGDRSQCGEETAFLESLTELLLLPPEDKWSHSQKAEGSLL